MNNLSNRMVLVGLVKCLLGPESTEIPSRRRYSHLPERFAALKATSLSSGVGATGQIFLRKENFIPPSQPQSRLRLVLAGHREKFTPNVSLPSNLAIPRVNETTQR